MRACPRILCLTSFVLAASIAPFAAETADSPSPLPKTVAVAAFKNGLAFVLRQDAIPLSSGIGSIAPVPNATLGSLWLSSGTPGSKLDEVVAYRYKIAGESAAPSIGAILQANVGKTVTIEYQNKEYTGEVVGIRRSTTSATGNEQKSNVLPPAPRVDYLLLRVEKRLLAIPLSGISLANLPEDAVLSEKTEQPGQALRFKVIGGSQKEKITVGYLEHGFGWTPSYLITLSDEHTAQITMQAVATNDAEDIQNADVFFVVGVPNFAYANIPSPMSLQQSLMEFMRDEEQANRQNLFSNAITGQVVAFDQKAMSEPVSLTPSADELSGAPEEDLFLYQRSGVTLAKGERASYNVFSGNVDYEHLYSWEVVDQPRVDAFGNVVRANPDSTDKTAGDSVWHSIRLKNSTKFPWTSAPALVVSGDKPVSQGTMSYTPRGASSTVQITVATDIRASHEEREVAREQNVAHRPAYNYDLVTVEGKLTVKNFKSKDVRLSISKNLRGKTEFQSDQGEAVQLAEGIQSDNPSSRLSWEITLKPGEERVVTYRYKVWVRP